MRTKSKVRRAAIETLEGRQLLSTTSFSAGNLTISKPVNNLTVETTAVPGQVKVSDTAGTITFSGVTGTLKILGRTTGSPTADDITVKANLQSLKSKLIVDSGLGADAIKLSGVFTKDVQILPGAGTDTISLPDQAVQIAKSLSISDTGGTGNTLNLNGKNLTVLGSVSATGLNMIQMLAGSNLAVSQNVTVNPGAAPIAATTVALDGASVTVGGNIEINAGAFNDVVTVSSKLSVGGNVTVRLNSGDNTVVLTPVAGGTGVGGYLHYGGIDGVDVIVFGANSDISGETVIFMGDGINTFVDTATSSYGGKVDLFNGGNTSTNVVLGVIAGDLNVYIAEGSAGNTTVITATVIGKIVYRSGNDGTLEVLTIAPGTPSIVNIDALFGTGDLTFTLGPNVSLTGKVVGTGGTYTFNQGTAILLPSLVLTNFP